MTREGVEIIKGAMRAISEQCMKTDHVTIVLFPVAVSALIIRMRLDPPIGFGRWFR